MIPTVAELRFRSSAALLPYAAEGATCRKAGLGWQYRLSDVRIWVVVCLFCGSAALLSTINGTWSRSEPAATVGVGTKPSSLNSGFGSKVSSVGSLQSEKAAFSSQYRHQYGYSGWLDKHWQIEVGDRLGDTLQHYLDFTASALVTKSNLEAASKLLGSATFSNPHSRNACGMRTTKELELAENLVLAHFNADSKEYMVVWTSGATQALKMVGEYFPWTSPADWRPSRRVPPGGVSDSNVQPVGKCGAVAADADSAAPQSSHFVYLRSNHKSVLGIGGYARERSVKLSCVDEEGMEAWLSSSKATAAAPAAAGSPVTYSLVAYPAKDNYEGRLYPWDWVQKVHAKSTAQHKWLVIADAAAYVPTHPLDLSVVHPDFVPISFYKMFGYPTGLGALIARKESLALLHKVYWGGGSVLDATAQDTWRILYSDNQGYMDGTRDFLGIAQLQFGFAQLEKLGGMKAIHAHTSSLQSWTYAKLSSLQHSNGAPLLKLFGRHDDPGKQSCLFEFLVLQADGSVVSQVVVEEAAYDAGLAIRTGCMCNPGQCQYVLGIQPEEERHMSATGTDCSSGFLEVQRPSPTNASQLVPVELPIGSIRASLGYLSTFEDCYALVYFLESRFKDKHIDRQQDSQANMNHD